MLQTQVLRMQRIPYLGLTQLSRRFSTSVLRQNTSNTPGGKSTENKVDSDSIGNLGYRPSDFDKVILVWTKKFPNRDAIPATISTATLSDARSKARIKGCNYMMLLTLIVCVYNIYIGRSMSVVLEDRKDGIEMHQQLREDYIAARKKERQDA